MGLYLELIDKEALFVPQRNEIVSLSPVHLSITEPDERYLVESENHKWSVWYDKKTEENNPMVFSHMNASWLGGALTPWDFSRYASGVIDRRLNPIPSWPNGTVLITPIQNGPLADKNAVIGNMVDYLHPMYKDIMQEFITDGRDYISIDGKKRFKADEYYTTVEKAIKDGVNKLPVVVTNCNDAGQVGWVVAQVSPTHLRLTLVDGGFLNPRDQKVKVTFNGVEVVEMFDILDNTNYSIGASNEVEVDVPCGMFRFIDIEITKPL